LAAEAASKETDPAKQAADEQAAKAKAEADAKATEALKFSDLKIPDGVVTDKAIIGKFEAVMNDDKLSRAERAQALIDLQIENAGAFVRQMADQHDAEVESWHKEIVDDKDLGGAKLDATMTQARKLMAVAATVPGVNVKRLSDDLARTGMTTHPDMIRMFHHLGQFVGQDNKFVSGQGGGAAPTDMASAWYGPEGVKKP
jgi:hypothetical protein